MGEAAQHPHVRARRHDRRARRRAPTGPAPRFSATPAALDRPPAVPGQHTDEVLPDWGFSAEEIESLRQTGAVALTPQPTP